MCCLLINTQRVIVSISFNRLRSFESFGETRQSCTNLKVEPGNVFVSNVLAVVNLLSFLKIVYALYQFDFPILIVWQCKPAKRYLIIKWVTEYVLKRHLSVTEEKIVHVVDQLDFSLVRDGEGTAVFLYVICTFLVIFKDKYISHLYTLYKI